MTDEYDEMVFRIIDIDEENESFSVEWDNGEEKLIKHYNIPKRMLQDEYLNVDAIKELMESYIPEELKRQKPVRKFPSGLLKLMQSEEHTVTYLVR